MNCKSEDDASAIITVGEPSPSFFIEEEFKPYVDSFLEEMESRGLNLRNSDLSVVWGITTANTQNACGYGYPNYRDSGKPRIEIRDTEGCWHQWSAIEKENLMYHELGHALLSKAHHNFYYPNDSPKSLMCSGYPCNNFRTYNKYQTEQREHYLDELVNPELNMPQWATKKTFKESLYNDDFDDSALNWDTTIVNDPANSNRYTFFIDTNNAFPSSSLGITSKADATSDAYAYWYRDFNVSGFETCANLKVRADIITQNLTEGNFFLVINLYDQNDENFALYFNSIDNTPGNILHENFETTAICLPLETRKIKVRLYLDTKIASSVFIDNLNIELYQ